MLDFILNESNVNLVLAIAAAVLPLVCFVLYVMLRGALVARPMVKIWLAAIGIFGPLVWVLWQVYNTIENAYGLDSVRALVLNLVLFIVVGIGVGLILRLWRRKIMMRIPAPPKSGDELPK